MSRFSDRLAAAVQEKGAPLCVGIDPDPALMPAGVRLEEFCRGMVDAVAPSAAAVKPQTAFFEALGRWDALLDVCVYAREAGLVVLVEGKRGDVPSTMKAYAAAFAEVADAVTVNPYLGRDSLEPFLAYEELGIFALVKTSNPGSADLQDLPLADGRPFWQHVAERVDAWGVEAVVGATHPEVLADARALMPGAVLLLPGIGDQGGRIEDLAPAFSAGPASALPSASRSVIYADDPAAAAAALSEQLRAVLSPTR